MELTSYFRRLFAYDVWGNRATLESIDPALPGTDWAVKILCHIIGAERVWLARLRQQDSSSVHVWPQLSVEECRAAIDDLAHQWEMHLGSIVPEKLDEDVVYRNTKGVEFRTRLVDLLQHVITHSAYHRGQAAAAVRKAGGKPAVTDYVAYVRQHPQR